MSKGFVYVLSNPAMPGLVKIGRTVKIPTERAAEFNTTGVPAPFEVAFYCIVEDAESLETRIHDELAGSRQAYDREFFRVDVTEAIAVIARVAVDVEHTWYRSPSLRSRPSQVRCPRCGASYVTAQYCPKCQVRLTW